jgi:transposase-like protein
MARLPGVDELFEGRHFDREIIVLCARWYLHFKLSSRDLVKMMAEGGRNRKLSRLTYVSSTRQEPLLKRRCGRIRFSNSTA